MTVPPMKRVGSALPRNYSGQSLAPEAARDETKGEGQAVYERACSGCHQEPTYTGPPVEIGAVGTDPAVAQSLRLGALKSAKAKPPNFVVPYRSIANALARPKTPAPALVSACHTAHHNRQSTASKRAQLARPLCSSCSHCSLHLCHCPSRRLLPLCNEPFKFSTQGFDVGDEVKRRSHALRRLGIRCRAR